MVTSDGVPQLLIHTEWHQNKIGTPKLDKINIKIN